MLALLVLQVIDNAYTFYLSYRTGESVFIISSLLSILILLSIFAYYILRRKLFTKEGIDVAAYMVKRNREASVLVGMPEESSIPVEDVVEDVVEEYDCPRCGFLITDGKVFCPKCGAQTRVVRK